MIDTRARLIKEGKITGLRIDHIDGLYDPLNYLARLRVRTGDVYLIVEKILDLKEELQDRLGMAIIFITHDLGVVAQMARRVVVMYAGQVVETGSVYDVFADPKHPYTKGLLESLPSVEDPGRRLVSIPGTVPNPLRWPAGCRFLDRCTFASIGCDRPQALDTVGGEGRSVRCHRASAADASTGDAAS